MNASEPLMTCRKRRNEVETGLESLTRDEQGRCLLRPDHAAVERNVGTFRADANRAAQAEALRELE
jgi:hypothetical protein